MNAKLKKAERKMLKRFDEQVRNACPACRWELNLGMYERFLMRTMTDYACEIYDPEEGFTESFADCMRDYFYDLHEANCEEVLRVMKKHHEKIFSQEEEL